MSTLLEDWDKARALSVLLTVRRGAVPSVISSTARTRRARPTWASIGTPARTRVSAATRTRVSTPTRSTVSTSARPCAGSTGSTAWHNAVRSRLYLKTPPDENDEDLRILATMKANYGRKGKEMRLKWIDGVFINVGVLETNNPILAAKYRRG